MVSQFHASLSGKILKIKVSKIPLWNPTQILFKMLCRYLGNNFILVRMYSIINVCPQGIMRLFKRRCSDPSPQLVSLSPIANDEDQEDLDGHCLNYENLSGQNSPAGKGSQTPIDGSPKSHRKGKWT